MDADPSGFFSMHENVSRHGCPNADSMTATTSSYGRGGTSARRRLNASAYAGGMTSLRFAAICPIFTNVGPRSSRRLVASSGESPLNTRCRLRMRSISRRRRPEPAPLSRRASTATCATSFNVGMPTSSPRMIDRAENQGRCPSVAPPRRSPRFRRPAVIGWKTGRKTAADFKHFASAASKLLNRNSGMP